MPDSLDRSFDRLENSLARLAAADAMNTAAVLNAIDAMREEMEAGTVVPECSAPERPSGNEVQADTARIIELLTERDTDGKP
ncbi:hypothetical protein [Streptomyces blattellae]|uniref:hypothetical protein n=1 Tax=Streptomyces blattellae TaxID=2569855 RepID=UPI0012B6BA92|nr:hypothetical protein [Streptomyces blattellae]